MGSVFPNNVVGDGAEAGTPSQMPNGLEELGVQRKGRAIVHLPFQNEAVHLPSSELPEKTKEKERTQIRQTYACLKNKYVLQKVI